jgi:restriction system protein
MSYGCVTISVSGSETREGAVAVRAGHRKRRRQPRVRLLVVLGLVLAVAVVLWVRAQPVLGGVVVGAAVLAALARTVRRGLRGRARTTQSERRTRAVLADQARDGEPGLGFAATAGMTGLQFEDRIRRLLEVDGCEDVRVVGGAGDRGADLTAISPYGDRVVVQCKRYQAGNPVRDPEMQRFLGTARQVHNAAIPLFVTTSRFTQPAVRLAREHGIVLVDGPRLEAWMAGGPSPLPTEPTEHIG